MSEVVGDKKVFSLLEVARSIQHTIAERYQSSFWIQAEMIKLNYYGQSGHCYPDLVEKKNNRVVAQMRSNLWRDDFERINENFRRILKEPLKDGIKILFLASISFHPEYGLSLRIIDIDPSFTLGDLEQEKRETLERLQREGIMDRNKQSRLPLLPQRLAIISVQSSKGYADFLQVLEGAHRSWGYAFFHMLFPSLLQGDQAVGTLIGQLNRIRKVIAHFDAVAIVRGGGGDIGLSCYNKYELARAIALFPIPVITGIGHATNETVAEMVAFENAITPTKLAEYFVQKFHNFSVPVRQAEEKIVDRSRRLIQDEKSKFAAEIKLLRSAARGIIIEHKNSVREQQQSLFHQSSFRLRDDRQFLKSAAEEVRKQTTLYCASQTSEINRLTEQLRKNVSANLKRSATGMNNLEQNLNNLKPENVLKRGYSITTRKGKSVRDAGAVNPGEELTTLLFKGRIVSIVKSTDKPEKNE